MSSCSLSLIRRESMMKFLFIVEEKKNIGDADDDGNKVLSEKKLLILYFNYIESTVKLKRTLN